MIKHLVKANKRDVIHSLGEAGWELTTFGRLVKYLSSKPSCPNDRHSVFILCLLLKTPQFPASLRMLAEEGHVEAETGWQRLKSEMWQEESDLKE